MDSELLLRKTPKNRVPAIHPDYASLAQQLMNSENVFAFIPDDIEPFVKGSELPPFWCRTDGNSLYIFFASPTADKLKFPLEYGQALDEETEKIQASISFKGRNYTLELIF